MFVPGSKRRDVHRIGAAAAIAVAALTLIAGALAAPQPDPTPEPSSQGPFGYPVKPFHREHPVRGYFGDPRTLF